ncbi:MAG: N-6 DNA methylase [Bacteroidota bacterium]|nr:N-6 DNA methylase [Bacteroidota bacterium]
MNEPVLPNIKEINSARTLLTEKDCIKYLQDIVSETAAILFKFILDKKSSSSLLHSGLYAYLKENHFIESTQIINKTQLENHLRLAALFLILQQGAKDKVTNEAQGALATHHLDKAFLQLPENFRKFLPQFPGSIKEDISQKHKNIIDCIVNFPADIIGIVYNQFSFNEHQQQHGQHFTQADEADILTAFCICKNTHTVLDSSCGSGTFLLSAFYFLRYFHPGISKKLLKTNLTGIDISPYASYLSSLNLFFKNKTEPYIKQAIINKNFLEITTEKNSDKNKQLPLFDACLGNPPFIRHEEMADKKEWLKLIKHQYGISYISGQSDLYTYFLIHTSYFLKEGARLGYVISASWLDVQFGSGLQKFLLDHFKIITIIDYQAKRSFETASVNTVLLVIEKCNNALTRKNNLVKFIRIKCAYENLVDQSGSPIRIEKAIQFTRKIENFTKNYSDKNIQAEVVSQLDLENSSTVSGKYSNGHWGAKYLRSPEIYNKIISHSGDILIPLSNIVEVKYGIKTGANDFFYLIDETHKAQNLSPEEYQKTFGQKKEKHLQTWKTCGWFLSGLNNEHFIIEKKFVVPVFKTQKEADKLEVKISNLKFVVINCNHTKDELKSGKKRILEYINFAEKEFAIHERPSVSGRHLWYNLTPTFSKGEFIFPSKIGEKFRLIDNRKANVVCDKVNYVIKIKEEYRQYADEIFLILNSICFRYFIDLFARQLTGSQTLSDVDVNLLKKTLIPHPVYFRKHGACVESLTNAIKSREQLPLSKEILQEDKFKIDLAIFKTIGLKENEVKLLYKEAASYVEKRQIKSDSLKS